MGLKDIIEAYKIMKEGTDFILECKEKGVIRSDLENKKYPELSSRFFDLEEKGKNKGDKLKPLDLKIAYFIHKIKNQSKIKESHEYGSKNIYPCSACSIQGNEE